jgi:hypothetical protein
MYYSRLVNRNLLPDKLTIKSIKSKKTSNRLFNWSSLRWAMVFFFGMVIFYVIISIEPDDNYDFSFLPENMQNSDYIVNLKNKNESVPNINNVAPFNT